MGHIHQTSFLVNTLRIVDTVVVNLMRTFYNPSCHILRIRIVISHKIINHNVFMVDLMGELIGLALSSSSQQDKSQLNIYSYRYSHHRISDRFLI